MEPKGKREAGSRLPERNRILCAVGYLLAALIGLALLLYPLISNYLYETRQDGVLVEYQEQANTLQTSEEREAVLEAARQYNRQLSTGILSLQDPFLTPTVAEEDGVRRSILDVTGSGIIATLSIPALSLELPVYYGTDAETLERGVGVLEISSLPVGGEGTHTVLCGHSGLSSAKLFSDLELLEVGDQFSIGVMGNTLTYMVDRIVTVRPEDLSQLAIAPGEDYCTLLTCTPYGVNTHRLLVRGTRIEMPSTEDNVETAISPAEPVQSVWLREYAVSVLLSLSAVLGAVLVWRIVLLIRKRRQT